MGLRLSTLKAHYSYEDALITGKERAVSTKYLTTVEVADLCRTSPETVRYWRHVKQGPPSFKVGRRVLYAIDDLEAWLQNARKVGAAA